MVASRWYLGTSNARGMAVAVTSMTYVEECLLCSLVVTSPDGGRWYVPVVVFGGSTDGVEGAIYCESDLVVIDALRDPRGRGGLLAQVLPFASDGSTTPLDVDQSNAAFVSSEGVFVKLYRGLRSTAQREVACYLALGAWGFTKIPRFLGSHEEQGVPALLALAFLEGYSDLYSWFVDAVRDGDEARLAIRSKRLGAGLRELHQALRHGFDLHALRPAADVLEGIRRRCDERASELARSDRGDLGLGDIAIEELVRTVFDRLDRRLHTKRWTSLPLDYQVIHGDMHLGQILGDEAHEVFIDFEGEPLVGGTTTEELGAVLYDLGGLCRSVDYACAVGGKANMNKTARRGIVQGYFGSLGEGDDGGCSALILRAMEFEKALYELAYELRARRGLEAIPSQFLMSFADEVFVDD